MDDLVERVVDYYAKSILKGAVKMFTERWKPTMLEDQLVLEPCLTPIRIADAAELGRLLAAKPDLQGYIESKHIEKPLALEIMEPLPTEVVNVMLSNPLGKAVLMRIVEDLLAEPKIVAVALIHEAYMASYDTEVDARPSEEDFVRPSEHPGRRTAVCMNVHMRTGTVFYAQRMHEGKPEGDMFVMDSRKEGNEVSGALVPEPKKIH